MATDVAETAARAAVRDHARWFGRSPEAVDADLESLSAMVQKWQRVQNLVSRETLQALWSRHILDSLQLLPLIALHRGVPLRLVDLGSGGGFPALPLAIALKELDVAVHAVEANGRKCAYLNAVRREMDLPMIVHNRRIETVTRKDIGGPADIVTARALAPLAPLLGYIAPLWGNDTRALLHKGREYGEEIVKADSVWSYDVLKHQSATDRDGVILDISHLGGRA